MCLLAHSKYKGPCGSNNSNYLDIHCEWAINSIAWLAQSVEYWTCYLKFVSSNLTSCQCDSSLIQFNHSLQIES